MRNLSLSLRSLVLTGLVLSTMAVPVAGNAFPGGCRVDYEYLETCTFTAGVDKVLVIGESDTADHAMETTDIALVDAEPVGITLQGPGVSKTWYRGAKVRELIDVTVGEDYELTVHITGSAAANSGYSHEDENYLAYVTSVDQHSVAASMSLAVSGIDLATQRPIKCLLGLPISREFDASADPHIVFGASFSCLEGPVDAYWGANLFEGTEVTNDAKRGDPVEETCLICEPMFVQEVTGIYDPCGTCTDYWTVEGGWTLVLPATGVWINYPSACWTEEAGTVLKCKASRTENLR